VYQYALVDRSGKHDLQELRSLQDWSLRYELQSLEGVAEVASVGGFEKQYLIEIDPVRMKAFNLSVGQIASAVRGANAEVGGRVIELAQHEYAPTSSRPCSRPISKAPPSASGTWRRYRSAGTSDAEWSIWMAKARSLEGW
jgi:multidrug efflux pump subunit AcrB